MISRINHIGIAVRNIDDSVRFYRETLNLKVKKIEEVKDLKLKVAFIPVGESEIELLQSTDPESSVARFIAKNGEGIHHMALEVDEIEQVMCALKKKKIQFIDEKPRMGVHKTKIAFLHPTSTMGVLLELIEKRKQL